MNPNDRPRSIAASKPALRVGRGPILAVVGILLAGSAAGCLPSGTRGEGSGSADSGSSPTQQPASSAAPTPNGPASRPPIVPPTPTPAPTFLVYVVRSGDSLNTIAHRFGTTARSIAFWNRSTYPSLDPFSAAYRPDLLKLGWTLFLVPNDVVDEQDLPDASDSAGPVESIDPTTSDPADTPAYAVTDPAAAPEDSAIPE